MIVDGPFRWHANRNGTRVGTVECGSCLEWITLPEMSEAFKRVASAREIDVWEVLRAAVRHYHEGGHV